MKLRLLKVICQPVFVVDDGESLREQTAEPVVVTAAEWSTYATTGFAQGFEALRQQVEGPEEQRLCPECGKYRTANDQGTCSVCESRA